MDSIYSFEFKRLGSDWQNENNINLSSLRSRSQDTQQAGLAQQTVHDSEPSYWHSIDKNHLSQSAGRVWATSSVMQTNMHWSLSPSDITPERSRQGVGTGHESSNFAASHYLT